jgi:PAS domain S-box-containing protein
MLHELRRGGFTPSASRVATEAAFLAELANPHDVILADYALPGFDALRALDLMIERGADVPVIVVSGSLSDEQALECIAHGATDYLLKDRLGRLAFAVRRALLDRQAQHRAEDQRVLLLREQAARAMAEREREHLQRLLEQAPAAICLLSGPSHVFTLANPRYRALVGHRELLGKTARTALPELAGQGIFELLDEVYRSGEPYVGNEVLVRYDRDLDGALEEVYLNFVYAPLRDAVGGVEGIFVHAVDVTPQVRARRVVAAERDRLQQVIDVLPSGVALADASGRIVLSNAAARAIWGQEAPEVDVHGYAVFGVRRPDGSPYPSEEVPLARSVLRGDFVQGEQLLVHNASTDRWTPVLVNSAPLIDQAGSITGGVVVFQDISSLKELEQQKDEFLAVASHDLKNPLAALMGQAQLLRRRLASGAIDPERLRQAVERIEASAARAAGMIDEVMDITRQQMGLRVELSCAPIDLVALARRVVDEQQRATERHEIRVEAPDGRIEGIWDEARLERVLSNLVSNAVKYSPQGGLVRVALAEEADMATITVEDQGVGIPAAALPRIFERFFRADNVAGRFQGSGIGLGSALQIVEAHGGHIDVHSQEGQGSTFVVHLPRQAAAEPARAG